MANQYPNSGTLGVNKNRREDSRDAEYSGKVETTCPHCEEASTHWLNAWVKQGPEGKFFSLSSKSKDAPPANGIAKVGKTATRQAGADMDDDPLPF